jgi:DNA-binding XRE family transcriptional regulator
MTAIALPGNPGHRSKAVRAGAELVSRLFGVPARERAVRRRDDPQVCIRAALRRRRRSLGLTQADAARLMGMQRLTYHRIEHGGRHIRFAELAALCAAFHCHVGELLQDGQLVAAYIVAARALLGEPVDGGVEL